MSEVNQESEGITSAYHYIKDTIFKQRGNSNFSLPEGMKETPLRLAAMWEELTIGYGQYPEKILSKKFKNEEQYDELVLLADIDFFSMCEHHLMPFFGKVHVGYIVKADVVGISKLARLVECFARRLQIQERMTKQIADALQEHLNPIGVGVIIEAQHLCMLARGIKKPNAVMKTSTMLGAMKEEGSARNEFMRLCGL